MDFDARRFQELLSKVQSIFGLFPFAKECKLAILGLSEMEELNDCMGELVECYGSTDACDFALRVVQAKWRPFQVENEYIIDCSFGREDSLELLALLYCNAKSICGEIQIRLQEMNFSLSVSAK